MIRALLVLAWHTCALPSPDRPCVEIETKTFSSSLEAARAYWKAHEALDRKLYFLSEDVSRVREFNDPAFKIGDAPTITEGGFKDYGCIIVTQPKTRRSWQFCGDKVVEIK